MLVAKKEKVICFTGYHILVIEGRIVDRTQQERKRLQNADDLMMDCSFVITRLDYCKAVLYGITGKNILRLQRVQNSLARVVCAASFRSLLAPLLRSVH